MGLYKTQLIFDPADLTDSDNVGAYLRAGSDGDLITSTLISGKEALDVNVVSGTDDGIFAEDSASANGDVGQSVLQVRQDALASSVSTDGDYGWFKMNDRGALWTVPVGTVADDAADSEYPNKIGYRAVSGALTAVSASNDRADAISDLYRRIWVNDAPNIGMAQGNVTVGATEVALPTTALNGRRSIIVQNTSNNPVYVGPTGVLTTTGIKVDKGATMELAAGPDLALFAIAAGAGNTVRVLELA